MHRAAFYSKLIFESGAMKIGELAKATGTQTETIRYYERVQLLPTAKRTESNYRVYDGSHVERLAFIRHCRSLDMTLDEIRVLLHFKDAPGENCGAVDALLQAHIGHVVDRIRELQALEAELRSLQRHLGRSGDCRASTQPHPTSPTHRVASAWSASRNRYRYQTARRQALTYQPYLDARRPPEGDAQSDFFVPLLYDVATKDIQ